MPLVPTGGTTFPESVPATVGMFSDVGGELVWNGHKVDLHPGEPVRELLRITEADMAAKRKTLTYPVDASRPSALTLIGAMGGSFPQIEGVDYRINEAANQVSWDGFSMDGLISAGDDISVVYFERA